MSSLQAILLDPRYHDALAILKGARNGFVYGCKIRFPHALVMTFLFSNKPLPQKIQAIFRATLTHAINLTKFVTLYKLLLLLQRKVSREGKERSLDSFVAGALGGWWVFGERTAIVLYVCSRVVASFLPRLFSTRPTTSAASSSSLLRNTPLDPLPGPLPPLTSAAANPRPIPPAQMPFAVFAAVCWGCVMYIYRHRGERLQPGMVNSMKYLYRDSESWTGLRNLLWHNK
ncbi:hypothetical protein NCC49_005975 [Naganishia albida]|nr:hypothetical protein NCC49_005975 [Naganishia albida]